MRSASERSEKSFFPCFFVSLFVFLREEMSIVGDWCCKRERESGEMRHLGRERGKEGAMAAAEESARASPWREQRQSKAAAFGSAHRGSSSAPTVI